MHEWLSRKRVKQKYIERKQLEKSENTNRLKLKLQRIFESISHLKTNSIAYLHLKVNKNN